MKTVVVMPAYNAGKTLGRTVSDIPLDAVDELILVDDASADDTLSAAESAKRSVPIPFTIVGLPKNRGYGGNQKECYRLARERGADIVVMLHPDYQYDPTLVKPLAALIKDGGCALALGSRMRSWKEAKAGGMPRYRYVANRFLSRLENKATGQRLPDWHTGMRAYKREVLDAVGYERFSDGFFFDTQMLFAAAGKGFPMGHIEVPVRYFPEASSISLGRGLVYGIRTLGLAMAHLLKKG